jgi:predicted Fe-Mo cluster-binding NifX family protein
MILAIPIFGCEISPRFDCAREMLLFRVEGGEILDQRTLPIIEANTLKWARILSALKVQQIICSGIDDFSVRMLNGMGIQVFPWISGDAHEALKGFLASRGDNTERKAIPPPSEEWKVPGIRRIGDERFRRRRHGSTG